MQREMTREQKLKTIETIQTEGMEINKKLAKIVHQIGIKILSKRIGDSEFTVPYWYTENTFILRYNGNTVYRGSMHGTGFLDKSGDWLQKLDVLYDQAIDIQLKKITR